jgi:hypothetical protein
MEDMGLPEFCQHASDVSFDLLLDQFAKLERNADQLRASLGGRNEELAARLCEQFTVLDSTLFAVTRSRARAER